MTHRPIAPIEINGFVPGGTPRALPIFEWVDPATLLVDEGYQRDSSERSLKLVRKIIAGWDWAKFKAPCAVMTDAGLELIDGQHTAIAAATHPGVEKIPVMIVDVDQRAERAAAFIGHNKDRVAVTAAQLHVAAIAAGDAEALAIEAACQEAGIRTLRAPTKDQKPGETMAMSSIGALVRGRGQEGAVRVLKVARDSGVCPLTQIEIKAIDLLVYGDEYSDISDAALIASISGMGRKAYSEANVFRAAHPSTPLWKALAITWFKNRRSRITGVSETPIAGRLKSQRSAGDLKTASGKLIENITHRPVNPLAAAKQKPPVVDSGKVDGRAKLNGWMPGRFLQRCSDCDEKYQGDRRSRSCADCAYGCREAVSA
jgi:hypothetical protein